MEQTTNQSNGQSNGQSKRGRKPSIFITKDGEKLLGLTHRKDGRWKLADQRIFSAATEAEAVRKYKELMGLADPAEKLERHMYAEADRWWAHIASEILTKPTYAAKRLGIEWIAYGPSLQAPKPLPTFKEIEDCWETYYSKNAEQKRKVLHAWEDFKTTTKVAGLADITPEVVIAYRDAVYARNLTGKSQQNIFTRIRRLFTFAKSRAVGLDHMGKVS